MNLFTSRVLAVALAFFAVAIGLDCCVAARRALGTAGAAAFGAAAALTAAALWYGYTYGARARHARHAQEREMKGTSMTERVRHVLTEARMVLPGAQALLGFQFSVTAAYHRIVERGEVRPATSSAWRAGSSCWRWSR